MVIESASRIEPCGFEESVPAALRALAAEIQEAAPTIGAGLHPDVCSELRWAVRISNAYHSNMLEGYVADPVKIDGALRSVTANPLLEMAIAHVRTEEWLDALQTEGFLPFAADIVLETHRRLYDAMPEAFRMQEMGGRQIQIEPGDYRKHEAEVGRHMPPSPGRLPDFMKYFESRYRSLTKVQPGKIISIPAAHHRLAYIHPFADGNGRVGRLMTHGMLEASGIAGHGLWSISRGLYGGLEGVGEYHHQMAAADHPRRGERDGRGNLSLAGLGSFTRWFLQVMLKEIHHARKMFEPEALAGRCADMIDGTAETKGRVLRALTEGGVPQGTDASLARLEALGLMVVDPQRGNFMKLKFPAALWSDILPDLFVPAPS